MSDIAGFLRAGPVSSPDLQRRFGTSQAAMSRMLSTLQSRGHAIAIGKARATRYAAPRPVRGSTRVPLMRVDASGGVRLLGNLTSIYPSSFVLCDDDGGRQVHEALPWFVQDMKPQGFLGRTFPKVNADLGLPPRVADWTEDHHFVALAARGEDCVGDLILGDESLRRHVERPQLPIDAARCTRAYEALAIRAVAGAPAGASVGGEQPKFAALLAEADRRRHVLVKFSQGSRTPTDVRWGDLLIAESLASQTLREAGLQVPRTRVLRHRYRLFLEVERFDRTALGRVATVTAASVDAAFVGSDLMRWSDCAVALRAQAKLSMDDLRRVLMLEVFGNLIGNSDMHFGNLTFFRTGAVSAPTFALAPAYDQLPMAYAPVAGELPARDFGSSLRTPRAEALEVLPHALLHAERFWTAVARDVRISTGFRAIARENGASLGVMERLVPRRVAS